MGLCTLWSIYSEESCLLNFSAMSTHQRAHLHEVQQSEGHFLSRDVLGPSSMFGMYVSSSFNIYSLMCL